MAFHRLAATPETIRWGLFSASFPPVLTVASGDTVEIECISGAPDVMPPPGSGFTIPPALTAVHQSNLPRAPGHLVTGPVAISGAEPGDMLEVRIDRIEFGADWGFCGFRPLAGTRIFPNVSSRTFRSIARRAPAACPMAWSSSSLPSSA
jgi:acetamidase/formamidase